MRVEVVYALAQRQWLVTVDVAPGTSARDAVRVAMTESDMPALDIARYELGVFGKKTDPGRVLEANERVEIYRPLKADPKEVRRALAQAGKTIGRKR